MRPSIAFGGGGGGSTSALEARIAALEASIQWNRNTSADGSATGPVTTLTVSNLSTTKRSLIKMKWSQTGASASAGIEFEPNSVAGNGDGVWMRASGVTTGEFDGRTTGAIFGESIANLNDVELEIEIDPVRETACGKYWVGAGATPSAAPHVGVFALQWTENAISTFDLVQQSASATFSSASWRVWTENT